MSAFAEFARARAERAAAHPAPTLVDYVAIASVDYGTRWEGRRWASAEQVLRVMEARTREANPGVQHAKGSLMAVAHKLSKAAGRGELQRELSAGMWWYTLPEATA